MAFPWENSWRSRGNTSSFFVVFIIPPPLLFSPLLPDPFFVYFSSHEVGHIHPLVSHHAKHTRSLLARADTHAHKQVPM